MTTTSAGSSRRTGSSDALRGARSATKSAGERGAVWRATGTSYKTHDLRHYAASALIAGGASVKQVQMILGHASAAVTLSVYAHLWPGDDDKARGILDAALADCVRTREVVG